MKRSQKLAKRANARDSRELRRDLVHAAGCVNASCVLRRDAFEYPLFVREARTCGVRVPRSLDRRWPR